MNGANKKNLKSAKNKRMLYLFFTTFFLSMFVVGFLIKTLSPSVDVEIGDGQENIQQEEDYDQTASEEQGNVDNRLKWIQFEDNMPGVSKRFDQSAGQTEERTNLDELKEKLMQNEKVKESKTEQANSIKKDVNTNPFTTKQTKLAPPVPTTRDISVPPPEAAAPIKMTKVYVGYYTTIEQAISVQNRLIDSNLNVSPFVKEVNGYYVVQVGSYANRQKAQSLYSEVSSLGFPAKMNAE